MVQSERDIIHEVGDYWVLRSLKNRCYYVMVIGVTHSISDSNYELNTDGLNKAVSRCNYLHERTVQDQSIYSHHRNRVPTINRMIA